MMRCHLSRCCSPFRPPHAMSFNLKKIVAEMIKRYALAAALFFALYGTSNAAPCPPYSYNLTNGTTADADQVMSNFGIILACANNFLVPNNVSSSVTNFQNGATTLSILNGSTGNAASAGLGVGSLGSFTAYGSGVTSIPGSLIQPNAARVDSSGAGGLTLSTSTSAPISLGVNNAVVGSVTSTGLNGMAVGTTNPSSGSFTTLNTTGLAGFGMSNPAAFGTVVGVEKDQNADTNLSVFNGTSGSSASSSLKLLTKTPDSYYVISLQDNNGFPYLNILSGPAIIQTFYVSPVHIFRNSSGVEYMRITSAGYVGIGTSAPAYPLDVVGDIRTTQAILNSSPAPTISACGTSPPAATSGSNNNSGQFTMGTGSPAACTVSFANAFPNNAFCTITPASSYGGSYYIAAQSKTAFTVTLGAAAASAKFNYTCGGN